MLQSIRSKASSFPVKVLFGVLIVAFGAGIWGTAGSVFRTRSVDTSVAHVGELKIETNDLRKAVRDLAEGIRQRQRQAEPLTPQQMKDMQLVDRALEQLVTGDLLTLETARLRLAVGDAALDQLIRGTFRDEHGAFNAQAFHAYLNQRGQSQQQFEATLRHDIVEEMLDRALVAGVTAPAPLVDALYRASAERRTAELVAVPLTAVPAPAAPGDEEIAAYYAKHK